MIRGILTFIFVAICVFLSAVILLQEGKSSGLGSISGMAESYWGKNKGRSMEGNLEKFTRYAAILWMVLAFVLNLSVF
ncbi:MAG: preprotein translocase subunit SecG [Clostridium sp.]|nr:preprotein translocase subunit SecG [Clostridium sp.]MCI7262870.1 preprotein translocase subunit SecG [Clostridiaceae bacterium]MDD6073194.1 preprotein translocase subunit SecG [Clostridium sp.]MDY5484358.1 preprotein translocase subunit SecG [Clostridium sp.]